MAQRHFNYNFTNQEINSIRFLIIIEMCGPVSLVVSSQPLQPDDLGSDPVRSTGFNRVITVGKLLTYSYDTLQIHSSVSKHYA